MNRADQKKTTFSQKEISLWEHRQKKISLWKHRTLQKTTSFRARVLAMVLAALVVLAMPRSIYAAGEYANRRQIEGTIRENGDLQVEERWTISFSDDVQGWTIPIAMPQEGDIDMDSVKVSEIVDGALVPYERFEDSALGNANVFLLIDDAKTTRPELQLTIYSGVKSGDTKQFVFSYTAPHAVSVAPDGFVLRWPFAHDESQYAASFLLNVRLESEVWESVDGDVAQGFVHGYGDTSVTAPIEEKAGAMSFHVDRFEEKHGLSFVGTFPMESAPALSAAVEANPTAFEKIDSMQNVRATEREAIEARTAQADRIAIWNTVQKGLLVAIWLMAIYAIVLSLRKKEKWTLEKLAKQPVALLQKAIHGVIGDTGINLTILEAIHDGKIAVTDTDQSRKFKDIGAKALRPLAFPKGVMTAQSWDEWMATEKGRAALIAWAREKNETLAQEIREKKLFAVLDEAKWLFFLGVLIAFVAVAGSLLFPSGMSWLLTGVIWLSFGVFLILMYRKSGEMRSFHEVAFDYQAQARISVLEEMPEGGGLVTGNAFETTLYALALGIKPDRIAAWNAMSETDRDLMTQMLAQKWF